LTRNPEDHCVDNDNANHILLFVFNNKPFLAWEVLMRRIYRRLGAFRLLLIPIGAAFFNWTAAFGMWLKYKSRSTTLLSLN